MMNMPTASAPLKKKRNLPETTKETRRKMGTKWKPRQKRVETTTRITKKEHKAPSSKGPKTRAVMEPILGVQQWNLATSPPPIRCAGQYEG